MDTSILVSGTYDNRLLALCYGIGVLTALAAFDLAGRLTANRGKSRGAWSVGGAIAMGSGLWCTHYIGMMAFRLPMPVYYHLPTLVLSLLAAVFACAAGLYAVSREHMTPGRLAGGSLLMGIGVAIMHSAGIAAMRLRAMHPYNWRLWVVSVLSAIVISFLGLLLLVYFRNEDRSWKSKSATALFMGLMIPVMNYTGMAAVRFRPIATAPDLSWAVDISTPASSAILVATCLILAFALITSRVDRCMSAYHLVLQNERNMIRALIDNIPDFMYVKDTESRFIIANREVARATGVGSPDDLLGKTDFDFFPKEIARAFYEDEQRVMRSGQPLLNREEVAIDKAGNQIPILTTKVPLLNSKGQITGVAGVGRNITNRKKDEEAVRQAHRGAEVFINAVPSILIGVNRDSRVTRWNLAAAGVFALPGTEVVGKELGNCGIRWLRPGMEDEIRSWCEEQRPRRCDQVPFEKDGKTRLLGLSIKPVHISDENLTELLIIASDVTERSALEEQLRQAQKLESVGQLAAGIAHEINTPMQFIGDNVRFLKDSFNDLSSLLHVYADLLTAARAEALSTATLEKVAATVERADVDFLLHEIPLAIDQTLEGVTRVSTLVSAMKEFSHPGTKEKVPLDLNRAIQNSITVARNEWKYVAEMITEFDPLLPLVSCEPGAFNQVILNLIVNAAHAIGDVLEGRGVEKGQIKVQTLDLPSCVEIRVGDTGSGIPKLVRERIFDPFFTTKEIGKGTGQGLAIARSVIVDKHGGSIEFETLEGEGTTFIVHLPHDVEAA